MFLFCPDFKTVFQTSTSHSDFLENSVMAFVVWSLKKGLKRRFLPETRFLLETNVYNHEEMFIPTIKHRLYTNVETHRQQQHYHMI